MKEKVLDSSPLYGNTERIRKARQNAEDQFGHLSSNVDRPVPGETDKIVLYENDVDYFASIPEDVRKWYCVSEHFDTHEMHQRFQENVELLRRDWYGGRGRVMDTWYYGV